MGAQLNIKDDIVASKLKQWARQDGQSVAATMRALVEREEQRRDGAQSARLERMIAFTKELQAAVPPELRALTSKEVMDSIYDDNEPDGFAR